MFSSRIASKLDPAFAQWLKATHVELPEGFVPTPEQMRASFVQMTDAVNNPVDESINVSNDNVVGRDGHSIGIRIYSHKNTTGTQPVCVFIHGGGWVLGNLDTHNGLCGDIALKSGLTVVAIDYRLSPEFQYPAALHDCEDVVTHIVANAAQLNIDETRMAIMGDSAGANLATACSLSLIKKNISFKAQVLVYPALGASTDAPSYSENADVPGLTEEDMIYFFRAYNGGDEPKEPLAAPLTVSDVGGQAPTLISAAEFDPLRDDGTLYSEKLKAAGVSVTFRIEPGVGHSYLWLRNVSAPAKEAFSAQTDFLKQHVS